ncbi:hypothetical protein [Nonomuraea jabiensis]|uniref:hypothetical protein n=1 Tax=Nonomuraea jabiensis TaxID=882448 RepID=UPI003D73760A
MPSWLDTLDIADKLASVVGLLVAIAALAHAVRSSRDFLVRRGEPAAEESTGDLDTVGEADEHQSPPQWFNQPPPDGRAEARWTLIGLATGWFLLIVSTGWLSQHPVPRDTQVMALILGEVVLTFTYYHTWASAKYYAVTRGIPSKMWLVRTVQASCYLGGAAFFAFLISHSA